MNCIIQFIKNTYTRGFWHTDVAGQQMIMRKRVGKRGAGQADTRLTHGIAHSW
jgi:hypothetical protein